MVHLAPMEDIPVSGNSSRLEREDEEGAALANGIKFGEICSSDIQVAINDGNRQRHAFFVVKIGKTAVAMPFQQMIPSDFAKYHPKLHREDITLEGPCGRTWGVTIRPHNSAVRFGKGWRQFSVESHLREGHQLLFHLDGTSRFVVHFFDNLGKSHASFPPLPRIPPFAEPSLPSHSDEEDASAPPPPPPPPPPPFELAPIATASRKSATPRAPALDSDHAKVILRQFFTQVHPNLSTDVPKSNTTVTSEVMKEHTFNASGLDHAGCYKSEPVGKQGRYEEHATGGGKAYIILESDSDDEFGEPDDLPFRFAWASLRRDILEDNNEDCGESSTGERTGFLSPDQARTPRPAKRVTHSIPEVRLEYGEQDHHHGGAETDHYSRLKYHRERQGPIWKKTSVRRVPWEGKDGHTPRESIRDQYNLEKSKTSKRNSWCGFRKGARDRSTTRGDLQQRVERSSTATLSRANLLLTQQRRMNYSDIVCKSKRGYVNDEERQRPLTAAARFVAGLKNESFLVVLKDRQVYHSFQLPIPRDFLEATRTLKADKVKVSLMDRQKRSYDTKWKWHSSCQTPLLNCDGWALFALDHKLEEGDVCAFELVDFHPTFVLSVHIFKVMENSAIATVPIPLRDDLREFGHSQSTPFNQKFGRQAPAVKNSDREQLRHDGSKKRPISDQLGRLSSKSKTIQKPHILQPWTKLFKPIAKAPFEGSRSGQIQF